MNRIDTRLRTRVSAATVGLALCAALGAGTLSGCGTGQISQTANQASAVNGTGGVLKHVALRNVRIQSDQSGDFVEPGKTVDLDFVVSNQSPDTRDELTGIHTDIGTVTVNGNKTLPAGGMLVVGTPAGQDVAPAKAMQELRNIEDASAAAATVALTKPISNGLTYNVTFDFKVAGSITLAVPISAGTAPQQVMSGNE
ncbi:Putative lipoprotein LpqE [Mycobacterium talmoniae]|uniref:Lipoprotein LpqE n=1 Tax=Mycobacterium talmoniae TaxID=1858794 RepID=A0A2S8BRW7_9MYCO|nr:hypothetical protein [Mycobacterium eburneum]PQM49389.1 Putative lipoprotein LpqE [Mycobacterium talmoniae]TDH51402.1 hypothetical protein E2F47_16125 [Mycobacterium eburneum]